MARFAQVQLVSLGLRAADFLSLPHSITNLMEYQNNHTISLPYPFVRILTL